MKWIVGIPLALIACLVALAFLGPRLVDWNSHKAALEREISLVTGYQATVEGKIGAALLPAPRVTVAAVKLQRGDRPVATVRWMEARLRLSDLLRGDLQVVGLVLIEPSVTLGAGGIPFSAPPQWRDGAAQPSGTGEAATGPGPVDGRAGMTVSIRDASMILDTAYGRWQISGIDGSVKTPTVGQRLSVVATLPFAEETLEVEARFAPPHAEADAPVSVRIASADSTVRASFSGTWRVTETGLGLNGGASISLSEAGRLDRLLSGGKKELAALQGPLRLETKLAYRPGDEARLDLAGLTVNGEQFSALGEAAVAFRERPRVDLALRFSRLALDGLLAAARPVPPAAEPSGAAQPGLPAEDEAGEGGRPDLLTLAKALPVDLSLQVSAAGTRFRGTLVQRLAVRGSIENGAVTLEEFSARLPGGADLSVAGFGDLTASPPSLEGNASLRADDLRRFLAWTGLPVPNAAPDRLRRFSLVSGVSLQPGRLDIVDASIELDDVTARGAAAVALRDRLGVGLRLEVDQLNLDAFRPLPPGPGNGAAATETADQGPGENRTAAAEPGAAVGGLAWESFDASLNLKAGRVVAAGLPFSGLSADLVLRDGVLTLNRASVSDAGGISGQASGRLDLKPKPSGDRFAFSGETPDLGRLAAILGGPDWLTGVFRSIGPGTVDVSYDSLQSEGPLRIGMQGRDGAFSLGLLPSVGGAVAPGLEIQSGGFSTPEWQADALSGRLELSPAALTLRNGRGRLNGGSLTLDMTLAAQSGGIRDLSMSGRIEGLNVARSLGDLDGALGLSGTVTLAGEVRARGSDWQALESANEGTIDLTGTVSVSVGPPRTTFVNVRQVTEVRDALRGHFSTPGDLNGRIRVENGTLILDGMTLQGTGEATIEAAGSIDLKRRSLAVRATLSTPGEDGVQARLSASGSSTAPNLRLTN